MERKGKRNLLEGMYGYKPSNYAKPKRNNVRFRFCSVCVGLKGQHRPSEYFAFALYGLTYWHPHNPLNIFRFRSNGFRSHSVDDTKSIFIAFAFTQSGYTLIWRSDLSNFKDLLIRLIKSKWNLTPISFYWETNLSSFLFFISNSNSLFWPHSWLWHILQSLWHLFRTSKLKNDFKFY